MPSECSKAALRRIHDPAFARDYFVGHALDIGAGSDGLSKQQYLWPQLKSVRDWDKDDGDAQDLPLLSEQFDCVHSSHCLEHMGDARAALARWFAVCKPGGHLVVLVPDEDLYEQRQWPSTFNGDHKWTFTLWKPASWSPVSLNVFDLIRGLGDRAEPVQLTRLSVTWNPDGGRYDRTGGLGESAIEFVVRKRP